MVFQRVDPGHLDDFGGSCEVGSKDLGEKTYALLLIGWIFCFGILVMFFLWEQKQKIGNWKTLVI